MFVSKLEDIVRPVKMIMLNRAKFICAERIIKLKIVILLLSVCSMYEDAEASSCIRLRSSGLSVSKAEKEITLLEHSGASTEIQTKTGSEAVHPPDLEDHLQLFNGKRRLAPSDPQPSPGNWEVFTEIQTKSGSKPVHPNPLLEDHLQLFTGKGRLAPSDPMPPPGNGGFSTKGQAESGSQPVQCHPDLDLEKQLSSRNRRLGPSEQLPRPENRIGSVE